MDLVSQIEAVGSQSGKTSQTVKIVESGVLEGEELLARLMELLPESGLVRSSSLSDPTTSSRLSVLRLSGVPSSSFPDVKRSSSARSGASPSATSCFRKVLLQEGNQEGSNSRFLQPSHRACFRKVLLQEGNQEVSNSRFLESS